MSEVPQDWIHEPPDMTVEVDREFGSVDEAIREIRVAQHLMTYLGKLEVEARRADLAERAKAARLWLLDLEANR